MKRLKNLLILFMMLLPAMAVNAQSKDLMRDNGRIFVVVAVMVTILLGLIIYLVRLDRKMTRIEKEK